MSALMRSDERWLSTIDALHAAAMGVWSWEGALRRIADATGSQSGQLVAMDDDKSFLFKIFGEKADAANADSAEAPVFGDRSRFHWLDAATAHSPLHNAWDSPQYGTPDPCRRDPLYQQILRPSDRPFVFLTTLATYEGLTIALLATRSERLGQITAEQREMFASLVPHARAAIRIQMTLEHNALGMLQSALEALQLPAFITDKLGNITAMTHPAVTLASGGRGLLIESAQLKAVRPSDEKALLDAIAASAIIVDGKIAPLPRTVVVRGLDKLSSPAPLVLDVYPLPSQSNQLRLTPRAMVVVRGGTSSDARRVETLRTLYGLTAAETDIAEQLSEGLWPAAIAKRRGVAIGTVRVQIKTIMSKLGVSRQIELSARLRQI